MDQSDEDEQRPDSAHAYAGRAPIDRRFAALVGDLCAADPRFARRVGEPRRLNTPQIMGILGVVTTLLLGIVPLGLGVHLQSSVLMTAGAVGTAFCPVVVPALVGVVLFRLRPLW